MNGLGRILQDDGTLITAWCGFGGRSYIETIAESGFDAVTLDMQHGLHSDGSIVDGVAGVASCGKPAFVRIAVKRFGFASRALDFGAHGIVAPMINSVEDARDFVAFTKYPPIGERSFGPSPAIRALNCKTVEDYVSQANQKTMTLAMIETKMAVKNAEAIIQQDGIDAIFIGPSDLSISFAQSVKLDPFGKETLPIIRDLAALAREYDKVAAIYCSNADHANLAQELGYRIIALGMDSLYINTGTATLLSRLNFR